MKRIRCPKCDEPITFDDKLYQPGRTLVFECPACRKEFKIRLAGGKETPPADQPERTPYGYVTVVENAFHYKQTVLLYEGENVFGRYVRGTKANAALKTTDPSVDTTHCIITVRLNRTGEPVFTLRDAPSNTGTFLMGHLLGDREQARIDEGDIITIGATTLIFKRNLDD